MFEHVRLLERAVTVHTGVDGTDRQTGSTARQMPVAVDERVTVAHPHAVGERVPQKQDVLIAVARQVLIHAAEAELVVRGLDKARVRVQSAWLAVDTVQYRAPLRSTARK